MALRRQKAWAKAPGKPGKGLTVPKGYRVKAGRKIPYHAAHAVGLVGTHAAIGKARHSGFSRKGRLGVAAGGVVATTAATSHMLERHPNIRNAKTAVRTSKPPAIKTQGRVKRKR